MRLPKTNRPNTVTVIFKLYLIVAVLYAIIFLTFKSQAQCEHTDIDVLPYSSEWCLSETGQNYENPNGILDWTYGCWYCMYEPEAFVFNVIEESNLTMTLLSDLTQVWSGSESVVYYAVFDGCPFDGGRILSYPINGNNIAGDCWEEFQSGNQLDIIYSCWNRGCCGYDSPVCYIQDVEGPCLAGNGCDSDELNDGHPHWNFPTESYQIEFNLQPGEYWFYIFAPTLCNDEPSTLGCINVQFAGPTLLNLEYIEIQTQTEEPPTLEDVIYFDTLGRLIGN